MTADQIAYLIGGIGSLAIVAFFFYRKYKKEVAEDVPTQQFPRWRIHQNPVTGEFMPYRLAWPYTKGEYEMPLTLHAGPYKTLADVQDAIDTYEGATAAANGWNTPNIFSYPEGKRQ
jgi:hypothetical protein